MTYVSEIKMDINTVYQEIKEVLKVIGGDEHLKNLQKISDSWFASSSEYWGQIGIYLRDLKVKDSETYIVLLSLIEKFTHTLRFPHENIEYIPMTYYSLQKHSKTIISEDGKHQVKKFYNENGRLLAEFPYPYLSDGLAKYYYSNGKLKKEIIYVDGKATLIRNFDENGNEIK